MENLVLIREGNILREIYYDERKFLPEEDFYKVNKYSIGRYYVNKTFEIGQGKDISIPNIKILVNMEEREIIFQKPLFHNFKLDDSGLLRFEFGDNVIIGFTIKIEFISKNILQITNYFSNTKINLLNITDLETYYLEYPYYTSSPRYIKDDFIDEVKLELPPEKFKKNTLGDLLKKLIPLFVAIAIGILMLKVRPRGVRGFLMLISMLTSASISLVTLYEDRKEAKRYNKHREEFYIDYLESKNEEANQARIHELGIYNYNDLSQKQIINEIEHNSFRLYEKDLLEEDFLNIRIGLFTKKPNYKIKNPNENIKLEKEKFELEVEEIYDKYKTIDNIPRTINLRKNNLGLIGNQDVITKQLHNILMQIIFSQSYHDTKLLFIIDENEYDEYEYYKWTKHTLNEYTGLYNFIINEMTKEQILNSYLQILRNRDFEEKEDVIYKPHLVFIITNYNMIKNHPIMEYLLKDNIKLGFSLIIVEKEEKALPKIITSIVNYKNSEEAEVLLESNKAIAKGNINLEEFEEDTYKLEKMVRKIGQLEHIEGVKSVLPDKLTFLEMFEVSTTDDLNIKNRWKENRSYDSLATVIGKKTQRDYVYLNLHEKSHGPHGLIAGTTGSGKSEVIQTYILSLAVNYSPEEVGFLLIDYKGGGMANLFKSMPHHLGSITNLDGYQSMRALASIKSELKRRQRIFSEYEVNHINGYHKLYEKDIVKEPLPHLFIISDEFAELKAEQPEFMKELVSAARIGRSLGIHLILATQKPTGVVDDQIWSNSKFKLSLKVAEESDSKELLKTVDAAYITEPGRGYLKVGNNELYELFQSGYSGATYSSDEINKINENIYEINKYGNKENIILEEYFTYEKEVNDKQEEITELKAVLNKIDEVYEQDNYKKVKEPWLEPLKTKEILKDVEYNLKDLKSNLSVDYGIVDLPNSQSQIPLNHDFIKSGHIAIFGARGMGKSSLILTMLLRLSMQNSPELLEYYIFDFGNSSLLPIKDLNHTAEYIKGEDVDKIKKVIKNINKEIIFRKSLFEKVLVNNFNSYNNISKDKKEAIIMVIDNIDALKEIDKELLDTFTTLVREAATLGIYLIITGSKPNSLKNAMLGSILSKIVFYTNEKSDITTLIGKSSYPPQEIPGRCQVKIDEVEVAQVYYPVESNNEQDYIDNMQELVQKINARTSGKTNSGLKEMPKVYSHEIKPAQLDKVYLGKEFEETSDYYIEIDQLLLLQGQRKTGKTNILRSIIEQLKHNYKITLFDDMLKNLYEYSQDKKIKYVDEIQDDIFDSDIFVINKLDYFNELDKKNQKTIYENLYKEYMKGKHFIFEASDSPKGSYDLIKAFKRPTAVIYIDDILTQSYVKIKDKDMKSDEREGYDYYYLSGRDIVKIRPFLVRSNNEKIEYEIKEEKNLMLGGSKIDNEDLVIGGKNSLKVIEQLKQAYEEYGQEYIEYDIGIKKELKSIENKVIIITNQNDIESKNRDERKAIYDELELLSSKNKIVLVVNDEKLKGVHPFLKPFKKPIRAIISDDLGDQKIKIVPRIHKKIIVGNDEAYYIHEKEVKKINL